MGYEDFPAQAAWRHQEAREGFETVFFAPRPGGGWRIRGTSSAVEGGAAWGIEYELEVDGAWRTRIAGVTARTAGGDHRRVLEGDGDGGWVIDGAPAPELDGCLDVDLEASAFTNALPIHRLGLEVGQDAQAPAAYVRALDLGVELLAQRYERLPGDGRFDYRSPAFDFRCELRYDASGLVLDYPGIAVRVA